MTPENSGLRDASDRRRTALVGVLFGVTSAIGYTLSNMFLREVATRGDLGWVSFVACQKAFPSFVVAWGLIGWQRAHGQRCLAGARSFAILLATGVLMQLGGNVVFQIALSLGGLAISVPLCFSTLILTGAVGGRLFLKESISRRTHAAMWLLIASVFVLQQGAGAAAESLHQNSTGWTIAAAVFAACFSGASFGAGGVAMRQAVAGNGTVASTIAPLATVGVFIPGAIAVKLMGTDEIAAIPASVHAAMLWAGVFNAVGFFAVAAAMARISLVRVNLINASQAALCALAGIAWFHEPASSWVALGTAMTIGSLAILGHGHDDAVAEIPLVLDAEQPPAVHEAPRADEFASGDSSTDCAAAGSLPPQAA